MVSTGRKDSTKNRMDIFTNSWRDRDVLIKKDWDCRLVYSTKTRRRSVASTSD